MLNLMRADIWRLFNTHRLRGVAWAAILGIVILLALFFGLFAFICSTAYSDVVTDAEADVADIMSQFTTPTVLWQGIFVSGGALGLIVGILSVYYANGDLKGGYLKSILPGLRGHLSYFLVKLLTVGVLSAVVVGTFAAASVLFAALFRFPLGPEPPLHSLGWLLLTWLTAWVFAVIPLVVLWGSRVSAAAYIFAAVASMGLVSILIAGLAYSSGGILRVLQPIAPALLELTQWMPSACMALLTLAGDMFSQPATSEILGTLGVSAAEQVAIVSALWLALAGGAALAIARRKSCG